MRTEIILEPTPANLSRAAAQLSEGKLVAFPTETVYGLGGSALSEAAVERIYATKGRPATDPLICHVPTVERAVALWDRDVAPAAVELAATIGTALWPGPLTIVCKAHPSLPVSVTGGSGFVGSRIPDHPVTLQLLAKVDFPLAGPSANRFGHVSPTTPQHVYDDLASRDPELLIIDGGSCAIGIESTVVKVNSEDSVEVLRRGKVTVSEIQATIAARYPNARVDIRDTRSMFNADKPMDGPGQLLTHYAPAVPCSLVTPASMPEAPLAAGERTLVRRGECAYLMAKTVIVDYRGILRRFKDSCLAYRDLSESGNVAQACTEVFEALRWTESIAGAEASIFPFLSEWSHDNLGADELLAAVEDRLFRAASGTVAHIVRDA